jgi:uncharacterized membrane protein
MTSVSDRYRALFDSGTSTDRIQFFSDAVFAIAMTLLVLEIDVPDVSLRTPEVLWHDLANLWPQFFAYGLGFGVIALNWMAHHRKFRVFTGFDNRLIQINLLLLLLVAFVPYPTALLSSNGSQPAAIILYAATVAAISIVQFALWSHARRAGLLASSVDRGMYRLVRRSLLDAPVVFGISIVVAALGQPDAAMYVWLLMPMTSSPQCALRHPVLPTRRLQPPHHRERRHRPSALGKCAKRGNGPALSLTTQGAYGINMKKVLAAIGRFFYDFVISPPSPGVSPEMEAESARMQKHFTGPI